LPIGVWSTSSTRAQRLPAGEAAAAVQIGLAGAAAAAGALGGQQACSERAMTSRTSVDLPEPDTPVTQTSRASGIDTSRSRRLLSRPP
jgi:hypothetical protein